MYGIKSNSPKTWINTTQGKKKTTPDIPLPTPNGYPKTATLASFFSSCVIFIYAFVCIWNALYKCFQKEV